jgi:hypothetical protein
VNRLFIAILAIVLGCNSGGEKPVRRIKVEMKNISTEKIMGKKYLFAHASVGFNIVEGLQQLLDSSESGFPVKVMQPDANFSGAGFWHFKNGVNGDPVGKIDSFYRVLISLPVDQIPDYAMMKLCYADFEDTTEVMRVFDHYNLMIQQLRSKMPALQIIHITSPLYAHSYTLKSTIRNFFRGDKDNMKRHTYNRMLREKYAASEPVFDLAEIESVTPEGFREGFVWQEEWYPSLYSGYTSDGGHLNAVGRKLVAHKLVAFLAGLEHEQNQDTINEERLITR